MAMSDSVCFLILNADGVEYVGEVAYIGAEPGMAARFGDLTGTVTAVHMVGKHSPAYRFIKALPVRWVTVTELLSICYKRDA